MYRGLIDHLAFVYGFICKGRGRVPENALRTVAEGAHATVKYAPQVLAGEIPESAGDRADLALAGEMDRHIEEAMVFLEHLEIV